MSSIVADTHAAVWFRSEPHRLSATATHALDEADANGEIFISAITLVELCYLVEKGRVAAEVLQGIRDSLDDAATSFTLIPVDREVADALERISRAAVPDMPDRIIAATALHLGLPLVTRDGKIKASNVVTIW
ncbi:MAG: type II toxin-antitoxin system VapC family toxin [Pyrinomonadaceae bacterium MAG19_C2-C3]|nr:type II toxin-antitoxin system VapC family toxin [Pyrinomonadaceae bacterium MAG19_C2-C3]